MSDPELLKLTASEPLSLDQEYEMQETWRNDEDSKILFVISLKKSTNANSTGMFYLTECTFLVLNKDTFEQTEDEIGTNAKKFSIPPEKNEVNLTLILILL